MAESLAVTAATTAPFPPAAARLAPSGGTGAAGGASRPSGEGPEGEPVRSGEGAGGAAAGRVARRGSEGEALRRLLRRLHLLSTYAENVRLSFQVHEESGRMMLRVLDAETGEVLKEIPPEDYLDAMGRIAGYVGALLDRRV